MKLSIYILPLCLLLVVGTTFGQSKKDKAVQKRKQSPALLLDQARLEKATAPTAAIKIVEEAITYARKQRDRAAEGEAYVLLGEIYEQIGQQDLALKRYRQALTVFGKSKSSAEQQAVVYQRIGQIYLNQGDDRQAEESFQNCLQYSEDNNLTLLCQEGLADVQLLRKDTSAVVSQLDYLTQNYALDSTAIARLEARRSQAYVQQKDYARASESFRNSVNTLPRSKEVDQKDFAPIQKAQEELLNFEESTLDDKVSLRNNIADQQVFSPANDVQIAENLKITELYESENKLPEAEKFLEEAKSLINEDTDVKIAADVYKKSSDYNLRRGEVDQALTELDLYAKAKEASIEKLEKDLREQIAIVQSQQEIDLLQRDFDLEEKDQALMQSQLRTQRLIIGLLCLLLIASVVFFYFLYKNVKAKRKANQLLLLKSLRTQMNPHFIFNALNSVNNFIAKNDEKAANKFLAEFSRLMRKVLDYSQRDFISFEEEMELNELYLKLEHFRFRDKFEYTFQNNAQQYGYSLEVPPMLIQPFIENAVWHGLRYKEGPGKLDVKIEEEDAQLMVKITDNGIGREKSKALKTNNQKKYKSTGLENVSKRIALINEIYGKNYSIEVTDIDVSKEDTGTQVLIKIPMES